MRASSCMKPATRSRIGHRVPCPKHRSHIVTGAGAAAPSARRWNELLADASQHTADRRGCGRARDDPVHLRHDRAPERRDAEPRQSRGERARRSSTYLACDGRPHVLSVLPFYYSYGDSVLHTHLSAARCVVLDDNLLFPHLVLRDAWRRNAPPDSPACRRPSRCCSAACRSERIRSVVAALPDPGRRRDVAAAHRRACAPRCPHAQLFVMYGQTEATARLSLSAAGAARRKTGLGRHSRAGRRDRSARRDGNARRRRRDRRSLGARRQRHAGLLGRRGRHRAACCRRLAAHRRHGPPRCATAILYPRTAAAAT